MRWLAVVLWLVAGPALAQTPTLVASGAGSFSAGENLAVDTDADAIAALEQQAFREFRWDVVEAARLRLRFEISAEDAATARLMISTDGEAFTPLSEDTVTAPGQVVSLLVAQTRIEADAVFSFPASDWVFEIAARPETVSDDATLGPVLLPIAVGDELGCATAGCGDEVFGGDAPAVAGEPRAEPGEAPPPSGTTASGDLARELQAELARVGCYTIAIDGLWGPGSRRAMAAFNEAQGTELTVETPSARALVEVARAAEAVCVD